MKQFVYDDATENLRLARVFCFLDATAPAFSMNSVLVDFEAVDQFNCVGGI